MEITITSLDDLKRKILSNPEAKAEYDALLKAELENLKVDTSSLMDKPIDSPEVKEWLERVLTIKNKLNKKDALNCLCAVIKDPL
ncbi:hypothetical protein [Shewanella psychromarinicola]|uniref:Uncharacterized protein n=1 Tax=Shewanella psychromarinicola TaxID=2487742 RepID=A0A3N4DBQ5_9GAMM|nr:hypothetical protein [Shewanella psychromarinicola]MCL1084333.1 hypothetical protein [Shewanella psychromarinicola]RPA22452.1 hypothetical protein EGC77_22000 [Shewanella psychromarinicola]